MKKLRIIVKVILFTAALTILITASISCSKEPDYAGKIAEDTLIAINENDYDGFMKHQPEQNKIDFAEADFEQMNNEVIAVHGSYVIGTKKFWKTEKDDSLTNVYYRAKFTKNVDVVVAIRVREIEGEITLVSFSLLSRVIVP